MNNQLAILISDYQASVGVAVAMMQRSGIPLPTTNVDWVGIRYFKHGYGCAVSLPTGTVDFDFGAHGEIDGFDVWRLADFAGDKLSAYGFADEDALNTCFDAEVAAGALMYCGYILYYLADAT
ncbi:DUF6896 domain-containing protein [Pseudomonas sp. TWRC1-2]|uniref:DUF6896 domain-containing protein n=1 Tax=Pseudomonas sp. TWRC1-2 TaxID=2804628 RepID=UPI003CE98A0C